MLTRINGVTPLHNNYQAKSNAQNNPNFKGIFRVQGVDISVGPWKSLLNKIQNADIRIIVKSEKKNEFYLAVENTTDKMIFKFLHDALRRIGDEIISYRRRDIFIDPRFVCMEKNEATVKSAFWSRRKPWQM